jgi:hypothetical protein
MIILFGSKSLLLFKKVSAIVLKATLMEDRSAYGLLGWGGCGAIYWKVVSWKIENEMVVCNIKVDLIEISCEGERPKKLRLQ